MYEEKAKNETHPFVNELQPTEQVLWFSVPAQGGISLIYEFLMYLVVIVIVGGIIGYSVMSDKSLRPEEQMNIVVIAVGATAGIIVFVAIIRGLYKLFTRNRPPERAYAITNQRLLYRNRKNVSALPLEHVPSVSLFLGDGGKGTFSFGAMFPMWPDVDDAIRIKHLIDDAQKKRMQRL